MHHICQVLTEKPNDHFNIRQVAALFHKLPET